MNRIQAVIVAASLVACAVVAQAHHSFSATFQSGKKIQVTGVVTEFRFANPHVGIAFTVKNADGSTTRWLSEGSAANLYVRAGWTKLSLKAGETVRISGDSTRDGSPMITMDSVEVLNPRDGSVARTLPRAGPGGDTVAAATPTKVATLPLHLGDGRPNLTGAWTQNFGARRGGGGGPAAGGAGPGDAYGAPDAAPAASAGRVGGRGSSVPYNAAGAAIQAKFDPALDPQVFCDPPGLVRQAGFTPHPVRITQLADRVILDYEEYGGHREVFLAPHRIVSKGKSNLGDSIAHYDGDALVIETKNLVKNLTSPAGNLLSDQMTTVETYRRADDPAFGPMLSSQMVVTDPVYLTAPMILKSTKVYTANYQFQPNDCRTPLRKRPAVLATAAGN